MFPFADEGEEVMFLAGAARFRRHLTDAQRIDLGMAVEDYFRPKAAERVGGRPKKTTEEKPSPNLDKVSVDTTKAAADAVGMSRAQYAKGKAVAEKAPEPVKEAWRAGDLSTHAAHELTRTPDPISK